MKKTPMLLFIGFFIFLLSLTSQAKEEDLGLYLNRGRQLFDQAYYEEAMKQFFYVLQSPLAPDEDKIKAHYYLLRIYRAYRDEDNVQKQAREILKLCPDYTVSPREPDSIKEMFLQLKKEMTLEKKKEKMEEEFFHLSRDMAILEAKLKNYQQAGDKFYQEIKDAKLEIKRLKFTTGLSVISLFILVLANLTIR